MERGTVPTILLFYIYKGTILNKAATMLAGSPGGKSTQLEANILQLHPPSPMSPSDGDPWTGQEVNREALPPAGERWSGAVLRRPRYIGLWARVSST